MEQILLTLLAFLALVQAASYDYEVQDYNDDILEWKAPEEIQKNFPYYLAGNHEGSPIWIMPYGAWPIEESDQKDLVGKQFDQGLARISQSAKNTTGALVIIDVDEFTFFRTNFGFAFDKAKTVFKLVEDSDVKKAWILNANLLFDVTWKVFQLVISEDLANKIEVHDKDDNRWRETIINWIPKGKLPEAYGGYENFTAAQNFG